MPTSNIDISTSGWTKVANDTDSNILVSWNQPVMVEFATTSANSQPTVEGHMLEQDQQVTRTVIGSGYLWARLVSRILTTARLVVTK